MSVRLQPLPTDATGAPVGAEPSWLPSPVTDEALATLAERGTPVLGERRSLEGIEVAEVGFLFREPRDHDVAVHLNGLTDRHRTDLTGARLQRIPGTSWWQRTYLLPTDGTFSYRFVSQPELPNDLGATRDGWRQMHAWGTPDPHQTQRLPNPLGTVSSVWQGPSAPTHPDWTGAPVGTEADWERQVDLRLDGPPSSVLLGPQGAGRRLVVLFDADFWRMLGVEQRYAHRADSLDLLLLGSGSLEERSAVLPHPDRVADRLSRAVDAAQDRTGRSWAPEQVVPAGQSYGGLAAAQVVARRPDIARTAVAQSGSYWYRAGAPTSERGRGRGDLLAWLASGTRVTGRYLLQVGSDEGGMADLTDEASRLLAEAGGDVSRQEFRGGHDYAWWRHGLSLALDEVCAGADR